MIIAALQKQSLIEYPGKISAILFLAGCNLRCDFCYVPQLVLPEKIKELKPIPEEEIFSFLKERKKFLDALAITGGEPTVNPDLPDFIEKIKKLGYLVEIETNGTNSRMLRELIDKNLIDYVAMDIKQNLEFERYNEISGNSLTEEKFENIKESIEILLKGKIDYEFRTTIMKEFHRKEDILKICERIKKAKVYWLQNYQKNNTISGKTFTPFKEEEILEILKKGKKITNVKYRKYL
jgi:pyruvate formate lyase activating enzyme